MNEVRIIGYGYGYLEVYGRCDSGTRIALLLGIVRKARPIVGWLSRPDYRGKGADTPNSGMDNRITGMNNRE